MSAFSIVWSNRSCVSGRALKAELRSRGIKVFNSLRPNRTLIRWGETRTESVQRDALNSIDSVKACVNKLEMLKRLKNCGFDVPEYYVPKDSATLLKPVYIRDKRGNTRFDVCFNASKDWYATKAVPFKRREYRIHVFDGKILSMYEKVPNDPTHRPALFKVDNCKFNLVNSAISLCDSRGQSVAIDSVKALGLIYGAVDLIRTQNGKRFVICEVNSSAGLNSLNVKRLVDAILTRNSRLSTKKGIEYSYEYDNCG